MLLVLGPCSAESYGQLRSVADELQGFEFDYFRAGLWKPRTKPEGFEGVKEIGLEWMQSIKQEFGYKIATEVASPYMVEKCLQYNFDMVWIGARTTQNPFIVEDIALALKGTNLKVMVKNPLNPDLNLWVGAIDRLRNKGIKDIVAVHRGFSLSYNKYRQSPLWRIPLQLKSLDNEIKIICDPSHIAGDRRYVADIASNAIATGFDGLMIEVHCSPDEALTDSKQQITAQQLKVLLSNLPIVNNDNSSKTEKQLLALREQISDIDEQILGLLAQRMATSDSIALIKKANNLPTFQVKRWSEVKNNLNKLSFENNLRPEFVEEIYEIIHQESIRKQNLIINKSNN